MKAKYRDIGGIDSTLHAIGEQQCLKNAEYLNDVDVKLVFTSPMLRALMTASLLFQNHPNKPKVIVLPEARSVLRSVSDISMDYQELRALFESKNIAKGLEFDFSRVDTLG